MYRRTLPWLLALLLAFALRFQQLGAQSFWNDEGNSARLSERSIPLILEGTASDIHPPLYYLVLRGWRELVGETEFGLRSFSGFVGLFAVALTMALMRELERERGERRVSSGSGFVLLAGLLTAVSPPLIYYSQEARMYALLAMLSVLSTLLLLRLLRASRYSFTLCQFPLTLPYAFTLAAGLYTHYFFPAVILGHAFYALWRALQPTHQPSNPPTRPLLTQLLPPFLAALLAGLLYLLWLPIFWDKLGGGGAALAWPAFLHAATGWLVVGETLPVAQATMPLLAALLLVGLGVRNGRFPTALPLIMTVTPLAFMAFSGAAQPQYFKFLGVAAPFVALLIAGSGGLGIRVRKEWGQVVLFVGLLGLLLWGNGRSLINLYANPAYARADYRGMAARIVAEAHPNAAVILNAPNQWEVFTYYFTDAARVYPMPRGTPNAAALDAELAQIAAKYDRLYVLFWGDAQRDPQRLVERWLDERAFKATEEWVRDVRFVVYAVPDAPATQMETPTAVAFGPHITLNGYTLRQMAVQPGDIVQVTLFWQTAVPLNQRYKVFLHLVGPDGALLAQRDSEPGGNLKPTTIWQPGEVVADNHGILLSADFPPGRYTLLLGLYDIAEPLARLPVGSPQAANNALPLAEIEVAD